MDACKILNIEERSSSLRSLWRDSSYIGYKVALEGYKSNRKFKDGSVIIFDLFEANYADNAISEGARKVVGVMVKDSKRFKETGGWGFEAFKGDTKERVVKDIYSDCFAYHLSQKDNDYVFSEYRK